MFLQQYFRDFLKHNKNQLNQLKYERNWVILNRYLGNYPIRPLKIDYQLDQPMPGPAQSISGYNPENFLL